MRKVSFFLAALLAVTFMMGCEMQKKDETAQTTGEQQGQTMGEPNNATESGTMPTPTVPTTGESS